MSSATATNGTRERLGSEARVDGVVESIDVGEARTGVLASAFELLSHYWCRPVAEELVLWTAFRDDAEKVRLLLATDQTLRPLEIPTNPDELLDEHERLFVGPGQVPCPPYESFWRTDVPVDIRRSLLGPCTSDLKRLYAELGLVLDVSSGELPDHVAVELEAIAYALSSEETLPVARELLFEHLGHFLPRLCRAVVHESEHDFYRALAALTLDWMDSLKALLTSPLTPADGINGRRGAVATDQ
jgi:putative dimethyl sulfoxide reductase chaperone